MLLLAPVAVSCGDAGPSEQTLGDRSPSNTPAISKDSLADSLSDRTRRFELLLLLLVWLLPLALPGSYRMRRLLGKGSCPPPSSASRSRVNDKPLLPLLP